MAFPMKLDSWSRWQPWLVSPDRIEDRFGVSPGLSVARTANEVRPYSSGDRGFLGEAEVTRRLAEAEDLNLFRPFPDSETAELVVRHRPSRRVIALQVKTLTIDSANRYPTDGRRKSNVRRAPSTNCTQI